MIQPSYVQRIFLWGWVFWLGISCLSAQHIERTYVKPEVNPARRVKPAVYPPSWWTQMQMDTVQFMLHGTRAAGKDIKDTAVTPVWAFVLGGIIYISFAVMVSFPVIKGMLLKLVQNTKRKVLILTFASVFADLGRTTGPLWAALACDRLRFSVEPLNGCNNPRLFLYGTFGVVAFSLICLLLAARSIRLIGSMSRKGTPRCWRAQ